MLRRSLDRRGEDLDRPTVQVEPAVDDAEVEAQPHVGAVRGVGVLEHRARRLEAELSIGESRASGPPLKHSLDAHVQRPALGLRGIARDVPRARRRVGAGGGLRRRSRGLRRGTWQCPTSSTTPVGTRSGTRKHSQPRPGMLRPRTVRSPPQVLLPGITGSRRVRPFERERCERGGLRRLVPARRPSASTRPPRCAGLHASAPRAECGLRPTWPRGRGRVQGPGR